MQYRAKSYRGNLDLNNDGFAEELWSPGYTLYTLMAGYRTKIAKRNVDLNLNVYNLFDKDYFQTLTIVATGLITANLGDPRTFGATFRVRI